MIKTHLPSRYSSLTSIYAYSSAEPFLGSSTPCNFATKVVLPVSLSPNTKTFLFEGSFVFPWFWTSSNIEDLKNYEHKVYLVISIARLVLPRESVHKCADLSPCENVSMLFYIQRWDNAARSHISQLQSLTSRRCDTLDPYKGSACYP